MTLEEHAAAISAAIFAAARDGFFLDNSESVPITRMELNAVDQDGDPVDYVRIELPDNPIW